MPFELRPEPGPPLRPEGRYLQEAWTRSVLPLARSMGVQMSLPAVSPQPRTRLAFEGYQLARERGKGNEYTHRVLEAFFRDGKDIGDVEVLAAIGGEVGLDSSEMREALLSGAYREAHRRALRRAEEAGITAVPALELGRPVLIQRGKRLDMESGEPRSRRTFMGGALIGGALLAIGSLSEGSPDDPKGTKKEGPKGEKAEPGKAGEEDVSPAE